MAKKYASLNTLSAFLDSLKNLFATKTEVNNKADTTLQTAAIYTDNAVAQKSQVQIITWGADE